jgi:hypothetical protein
MAKRTFRYPAEMRLAGMSSRDSDGECTFFQASAESKVHWRTRQIGLPQNLDGGMPAQE